MPCNVFYTEPTCACWPFMPSSASARYGFSLSGRRADLAGADLSYLNLSGSNLTNGNLRGANLRRCDLTGVALRGADLRETPT